MYICRIVGTWRPARVRKETSDWNHSTVQHTVLRILYTFTLMWAFLWDNSMWILHTYVHISCTLLCESCKYMYTAVQVHTRTQYTWILLINRYILRNVSLPILYTITVYSVLYIQKHYNTNTGMWILQIYIQYIKLYKHSILCRVMYSYV